MTMIVDRYVEKIEPYEYNHSYRVTVTRKWSSGFLWWRRVWFDTRSYIGDATVWHVYPSGDRCGTHMEAWLADRLTQWKWAQRAKS